MAGEIIEGKRTFIQRQNREPFPLPEDDQAEFTVFLSTPPFGQEGGLYAVDRLEVEDDRVVVHIGDERGNIGFAVGGDRPGYPFPED